MWVLYIGCYNASLMGLEEKEQDHRYNNNPTREKRKLHRMKCKKNRWNQAGLGEARSNWLLSQSQWGHSKPGTGQSQSLIANSALFSGDKDGNLVNNLVQFVVPKTCLNCCKRIPVDDGLSTKELNKTCLEEMEEWAAAWGWVRRGENKFN